MTRTLQDGTTLDSAIKTHGTTKATAHGTTTVTMHGATITWTPPP